jgi:hypothetical protein
MPQLSRSKKMEEISSNEKEQLKISNQQRMRDEQAIELAIQRDHEMQLQ